MTASPYPIADLLGGWLEFTPREKRYGPIGPHIDAAFQRKLSAGVSEDDARLIRSVIAKLLAKKNTDVCSLLQWQEVCDMFLVDLGPALIDAVVAYILGWSRFPEYVDPVVDVASYMCRHPANAEFLLQRVDPLLDPMHEVHLAEIAATIVSFNDAAAPSFLKMFEGGKGVLLKYVVRAQPLSPTVPAHDALLFQCAILHTPPKHYPPVSAFYPHFRHGHLRLNSLVVRHMLDLFPEDHRLVCSMYMGVLDAGRTIDNETADVFLAVVQELLDRRLSLNMFQLGILGDVRGIVQEIGKISSSIRMARDECNFISGGGGDGSGARSAVSHWMYVRTLCSKLQEVYNAGSADDAVRATQDRPSAGFAVMDKWLERGLDASKPNVVRCMHQVAKTIVENANEVHTERRVWSAWRSMTRVAPVQVLANLAF